MPQLRATAVPPLSVFIIAKNEADRIGRAIASVRDISDDIVVVDSESADRTVAVAQEAGATKVVIRPFGGYGPQKRFAETLCRHRWVMNIDADEVLTDACRQEIVTLFKGGAPEDAIYTLDVRLVLPHEARIRRFAPNTVVRRLYPKDRARFRDSPVHDTVIATEGPLPIRAIHSPVAHHSFRSYDHAVEKMNAYTTMQAQDLSARGKSLAAFRIMTEPIGSFFKAYILRRYALAGLSGFLYSVIYAFGRTLRVAKALELNERTKRP